MAILIGFNDEKVIATSGLLENTIKLSNLIYLPMSKDFNYEDYIDTTINYINMIEDKYFNIDINLLLFLNFLENIISEWLSYFDRYKKVGKIAYITKRYDASINNYQLLSIMEEFAKDLLIQRQANTSNSQSHPQA